MAHQAILSFQTRGRGTQDITREVAEAVAASGLPCGLAQVFMQHTSCSQRITENADPDVRRDLGSVMVRKVLTNTGITIPIGAGRLLLGTWQGTHPWDHQTRPHRRTVVVTVFG